MPDINLRVNGSTRKVNAEADTPLLYVLRNDLGLNGAPPTCLLPPPESAQRRLKNI